jgi:hypothetical protein
LFICPEERNFNYTYAKQIGYASENAFLIGNVDNLPDKISWVGNTSQKWDQIINKLYSKADLDLILLDDENITVKKVEMGLNPICYELENFGQHLEFIIDRPCNIIFTDPNSQLYHRVGTNIVKGDRIQVKSHTGKVSGTQTYYKLKMTLLKKSEKKFNCTTELSVTYAECVNGELKKNLMQILSCIPSWLMHETRSTPHHECPNTINMESKVKADFIKDKLQKFVKQINYEDKVELESDNACKLPCNQLEIYAHETSYFEGEWDNNWFNLHFEDMAEVKKDVSNYDEFNLIVEVGSSLGLWIGLSALAVFDIVIKFLGTSLMTMANRWRTATSKC